MNVSSIIPVYNGEKYLAEAIESILAQSCQSSEILVLDDGTLAEASDFLSYHSDTARPFLGGTDVFVRMRDGFTMPKFLVVCEKSGWHERYPLRSSGRADHWRRG